MKVLFDEKILKQFNAHQLFRNVLNLFDDFNMKQFLIKEVFYDSYQSSNLETDVHQKVNKDPTWKSILLRDKYVHYINDFKKKVQYLKMQMTDDELIIFQYSIEEREIDKVIMNRINKSSHKYYQIKKSCYLKIALMFELVSSVEVNSCLEITQMI